MSVSQSTTNAIADARRIKEALASHKECLDADHPDLYALRAASDLAEEHNVKSARLAAMLETFYSRLATGGIKENIFEEVNNKNRSTDVSEMGLSPTFLADLSRVANLRTETLFNRHYTGANNALLVHGRADKVTKEKARKTLQDVQKETSDSLKTYLKKRCFTRTYNADDSRTREIVNMLRTNDRVLSVFGKTSLRNMRLSDSALQDVFKEYSRSNEARSDVQHITDKQPGGSKMAVYNYVAINRKTTNPIFRSIVSQIEADKEGQEGVLEMLQRIGSASNPTTHVYCTTLSFSRYCLGCLPSLGMTGKKNDERVKETASGEDAIDSAIVMLCELFFERHRELVKKSKTVTSTTSRPASPDPNAAVAAPYVARGQPNRTASNSTFVDGRQQVPFTANPVQRDAMFASMGASKKSGAGSRSGSPANTRQNQQF